MVRICIHNYGKRYESAMGLLKKQKVSKNNMDIILRFRNACILNNLSKPRIIRYLNFFVFLFKFFKKDLDKITKEDIEEIVTTINTKDISPVTKYDCKVMLKRFYKWFLGNDKEYPEEVKWMKINIKRTERKLVGEGELITPKTFLQ